MERVASGSPYEQSVGFSRAVRVGPHIHVSGTAPVWPDGQVDPDPLAQARRCWDIAFSALAELGGGPADVVRTRQLITDRAVADVVSAAHAEVFADIRPASTMVVVAGLLDPRWVVEVELDAYLDGHRARMERYDELRTARLLMRRWRGADRAPFADMNADPEVMEHFPATMGRAASEAFVHLIEQRFDEQGFGLWALEPLAGGGFIGLTGLNPLPEGVPGAGGMEVGWRLARRAWGHGYATEAARAALRVAFDRLGLPEVWSMTAVTNLPSQRVMQRLGMSEFTFFEHPRIPEGSPVRPHVMYRITLQEYVRARFVADVGITRQGSSW